MASATNTSATAAENHQAQGVDTRPLQSPYNDELNNHKLKFQDNVVLTVHAAVVSQYPFLSEHILANRANIYLVRECYFEDVPGVAGHTLVHYLYSHAYQCLKPDQYLSPDEKAVFEIRTSMQVYQLAQQFKITGLEELARDEMRRLGSSVSMAQLLDALANTYRFPEATDTWLRDYFKSLLEPLLELPDPDKRPGPSKSLPSLVLSAVMELLHDRNAAQPSSDHPEPGLKSESPAKMGRKGAEEDGGDSASTSTSTSTSRHSSFHTPSSSGTWDLSARARWA
ncbi:hypothetical protein GGR52DRAFT_10842 [Hypoxylon sp. FL1284]|nr:hypothetical protein GGR52DRAFT_10842 [Hypoxylon sp. FL1284]